MRILDNISRILDEKKLKQKDLTDYLGISKNCFTDWKNGKSASYKKYLPQIVEFLGVSVDYLVGKEEQSDNEKLAFALYGTSEIDEEILNDVRKYALIARKMREENKKEG